jgi:hypothetical protein
VVHLASHLGGKPVWRDDILGFVPGEAPQKRVCVGGINGVYASAIPWPMVSKAACARPAKPVSRPSSAPCRKP